MKTIILLCLLALPIQAQSTEKPRVVVIPLTKTIEILSQTGIVQTTINKTVLLFILQDMKNGADQDKINEINRHIDMLDPPTTTM